MQQDCRQLLQAFTVLGPCDPLCVLFVTAGSRQLALTLRELGLRLEFLGRFTACFGETAARQHFPRSLSLSQFAVALPSTDAQHRCGRKTHSLLRMNHCYITHPGV